MAWEGRAKLIHLKLWIGLDGVCLRRFAPGFKLMRTESGESKVAELCKIESGEFYLTRKDRIRGARQCMLVPIILTICEWVLTRITVTQELC